ncbi:MAG TPA: hypothetical protein VK724_11425 [Bryobacteraceae bacterium]|jgi:hypothetical protein|nr:hypothetical protein [Bryobacteraceae bacterium]
MCDGISLRSRAAGRRAPAALALIVFICGTTPTARAQPIPTNSIPRCAVSAAAFSLWFQSGAPAVNGFVMPANSIQFSHPKNSNCAFYQWAEQMFFWLTSPVPPNSGYGSPSGARILDSTAFFDVSPPANCTIDVNGNYVCTRTLVPHPVLKTLVRAVAPRTTKPGPHGLPLVFVKGGPAVEILPLRLSAKRRLLVNDARGKTAEVARLAVDRKAHATLYDVNGKRILLPLTPALPRRGGGHTHLALAIRDLCGISSVSLACNGFGASGVIDIQTGSVLETETGQASGGAGAPQGGGVLIPGGAAVNAGSSGLVYYAILVNDVFAYFAAGLNNGAFDTTQFPVSQSDLMAIQKFAGSGVNFPDANALTMELKTAWIDASTLPAGMAAQYITTQGMIPIYTPNSAQTEWTATGQQKQVTLALVGMHVVGSAFGHPEMIFATFEHVGNAPNANYNYIAQDATGAQTSVQQPANSGGSWLLSATNAGGSSINSSNAGGSFNLLRMVLCPGNGNIYALTSAPLPCPLVAPPQGNFTIGASNTIRMKPWGAAADTTPNPNVTSAAESNSEVISVNSSVLSAMTAAGAGADVRNNYMLIGATWTQGGAAQGYEYGTPTNFYGPGPDNVPRNVVGTSQLFNTTMETYDQGPSINFAQNGQAGFNCFDCHGSAGSLSFNYLSHIISELTANQVPK